MAPNGAAMTRAARLPILIALFCALTVRALVPVGWMPAPAEGAFAIELCPGAGAPTMAGMDDGKKDAASPSGNHHHDQKDQHGDCAFSPLHAGFADLHQAPALFAAPAIADAPLLWSSSPALTTGPPLHLPPARGPPAIA